MPDLPPSKLRIFQWSFYPSLCWKPTTWVLPSKCIKDQTSSCHIPSPVPPLSKSLSSLTWKIAEGFPGFHTCSPTGFSQNSSQHNPFKKNTSLLCSELSINAPFHSVKATVCTMTPHDLAVHCLSLTSFHFLLPVLSLHFSHLGLLVLEHADTLSVGPLHALFSVPDIYMANSLTSFTYLIKCHLLDEA